MGTKNAAETPVGPNRDLGPDGTVVGGLAISVSDLDRSSRFYRALGFSIGQPFQVLAAYGPLLGLPPGFQARAAYIRRDRIPIELVEVVSPRTHPVRAAAALALMRMQNPVGLDGVQGLGE